MGAVKTTAAVTAGIGTALVALATTLAWLALPVLGCVYIAEHL